MDTIRPRVAMGMPSPARHLVSTQVVLRRAGVVESRHRIDAAVVDREGRRVGRVGDPDLVTFMRSSAKPIQALAMVREGVASRFGIPPDELALCCASHSGESRHVEGVRALMDRCGIPEASLECGAHPPISTNAAEALLRGGGRAGPIHNNCSGKHAGMLALAKHRGWPLAGYVRSEHPVQRRMVAEVARLVGRSETPIAEGTDGCGVVCFALPLSSMARAYARLATSAEGDAMAREGDPASRAVLDAMAGNPFQVAGTGRLCTRIVAATGGRVIAKVGAEGVYCAVHRESATAVALKAGDGATRAAEVAMVRILEQLGLLEKPALHALADRRPLLVVNRRGESAAVLEAEFTIEEDG